MTIEVRHASPRRHPAEDEIDVLVHNHVCREEAPVFIDVRGADHAWGLWVNGRLLGTSKVRSDCDFAKTVLVNGLSTDRESC